MRWFYTRLALSSAYSSCTHSSLFIRSLISIVVRNLPISYFALMFTCVCVCGWARVYLYTCMFLILIYLIHICSFSCLCLLCLLKRTLKTIFRCRTVLLSVFVNFFLAQQCDTHSMWIIIINNIKSKNRNSLLSLFLSDIFYRMRHRAQNAEWKYRREKNTERLMFYTHTLPYNTNVSIQICSCVDCLHGPYSNIGLGGWWWCVCVFAICKIQSRNKTQVLAWIIFMLLHMS